MSERPVPSLSPLLNLMIVLQAQVELEEGALEKKYGSEYSSYKETAKRFIPYLY